MERVLRHQHTSLFPFSASETNKTYSGGWKRYKCTESEVQGRQTCAVTNAQTDVADKDRWCQSLQSQRNKDWGGGSRKLVQHVAHHFWQSQSFILWSPKPWVLIRRNTHIQTNIYWFLSVGGHFALAAFGQLLFFLCLKFLFWLFAYIVNSNNSFVLFFFFIYLNYFSLSLFC